MVDRNLIRQFNVDDDELFDTLGDMAQNEEDMENGYSAMAKSYDVNQIVDGIILRVDGDGVLV